MKFLWRITITTLALLMLGLFAWQSNGSGVLAQEEPPTVDASVRSVTVSGTGEVEVRPDTAFVRFSVVTEAEEASAALAQNNEQMQAVIDALTQADIAEENIQTQTVRLEPVFPQPEPRPQEGPPVEPEITGYRAMNTVEVEVESLENVGSLIDTAVQAGANQVEGIRFEVSDRSAQLDQAREAAWQDALDKAQQLASLADASLGPALNINATGEAPFPVVEETFARDVAAAVPIAPGTQTVRVDLRVTWQLQ